MRKRLPFVAALFAWGSVRTVFVFRNPFDRHRSLRAKWRPHVSPATGACVFHCTAQRTKLHKMHTRTHKLHRPHCSVHRIPRTPHANQARPSTVRTVSGVQLCASPIALDAPSFLWRRTRRPTCQRIAGQRSARPVAYAIVRVCPRIGQHNTYGSVHKSVRMG